MQINQSTLNGFIKAISKELTQEGELWENRIYYAEDRQQKNEVFREVFGVATAIVITKGGSQYLCKWRESLGWDPADDGEKSGTAASKEVAKKLTEFAAMLDLKLETGEIAV